MNFLKRLLARLVHPHLAAEIQSNETQLIWERAVRLKLQQQIKAHHREHGTLRAAIENICDQRDLALESLMALVSRAEDGSWTTVFDADTKMPNEISDYLDGLSARA